MKTLAIHGPICSPTACARLAVSALPLLLLLATGCAINQRAAELHLERGEDALARKDMDAALAEFLQAAQLNPDSPKAHTRLGQTYKQAGDLQQASTSLETAVRLDPFSFVASFELGEVYRLLDRLTQAIRAYVRACELNPFDFEARFRLASTYHRNGDFDEAAAAYKEALDLNPNNHYAWTNLGAVYDLQGKYYEAIRAYKESLERKTRQPVVLINLATAYIHQDRWETARKTLRVAIEMAPDLSIAHERYGYCLWRDDQLDEAARSYLRAMGLDSRNAAAFAGYGAVRITQYLNDAQRVAYLDEAIEAWHTSLELEPDQPRLRALIAKYRPQSSGRSVDLGIGLGG